MKKIYRYSNVPSVPHPSMGMHPKTLQRLQPMEGCHRLASRHRYGIPRLEHGNDS